MPWKKTSEPKHNLRRCVYCELQFQNRLESPMDDFSHVDEMCDQLYFDTLGHGFNGKPLSFWAWDKLKCKD